MRVVTKILDAVAGDSSIFSLQKDILLGQLSILGVPNANIRAFVVAEDSGVKLLKVSCSDWGSGSLVLKAKTNHADDTSFDETMVIYTENCVEQVELFQSK